MNSNAIVRSAPPRAPAHRGLANPLLWAYVCIGIVVGNASPHAYGDLVTLDELTTWTFTGTTGSYYNGDSGIGTNSQGWSSGGIRFGNAYNDSFGGFWNGFAYSNVAAPNTPGFGNQYAARPGAGVGGSGNYAIAYAGPYAFLNLSQTGTLESVAVTNTSYAYYSMRDGDPFSKKFGGPSRDEADFFSVVFTGYSGLDGTGDRTGEVEFFLADYRFADNALDYLIDEWTTVDLSSLGPSNSLRLSFTSSDRGEFGINTPTYVALDHFRFSAVPEPSSGLLGALALGVGWAIRRRSRGT